MAPASLTLFVDLGDLFTKVIAVKGDKTKCIRFPSVIAHQLVDEAPAASRLLLFGEKSFPRPLDFDAEKHSRLRSYPGRASRLERARQRGMSTDRARFAGRLAVIYGADRCMLGTDPSEDNVDALVRKALLRMGSGCSEVELVCVVDSGAKASAIERYATEPREIEFMKRTFKRPDPEPMRFDVAGRVVDAAECLMSVIPPELREQRVLLMDVGYLRTKLAIVSASGCEHQEVLDDLGVSDCVRRILRDGQELGLVEDEFAIIWALERRSASALELAGREFDIASILEKAERALSEELARAVDRVLRGHYGRGGGSCPVVVVAGGGSTLIADTIRPLLGSYSEEVWAPPSPNDLLVEGALALSLR